MDNIQLHILSPEGSLVQARVELVTLPGVAGPFTVLKDHAALITALEKGNIRYVEGGEEKLLPIREGFVEVGNNEVKVCVEV
jgi:F-type H+-transporting ATPase subunit epsilon